MVSIVCWKFFSKLWATQVFSIVFSCLYSIWWLLSFKRTCPDNPHLRHGWHDPVWWVSNATLKQQISVSRSRREVGYVIYNGLVEKREQIMKRHPKYTLADLAPYTSESYFFSGTMVALELFSSFKGAGPNCAPCHQLIHYGPMPSTLKNSPTQGRNMGVSKIVVPQNGWFSYN